eukprot:7284848-Prymnesium_polylepis.1
MAVVKRRLVQVLPGWRCFLDVDDLDDISRLEAHIDASASVLFFLSSGYFHSANCLREVRRSVEAQKNLVLLHEADTGKGGLTLAAARDECPDELRGHIFAAERVVIPWHRLSAYQLLSLRLVAEQALINPAYRDVRLTYKSEVTRSKVLFPKPVSLFASGHNPGAVALIDELNERFGQLTRTDERPSVGGVFLLYLNAE